MDYKIKSGEVVQQTSGEDSERGRFLIVEKQIENELYTICYSLVPQENEIVVRTDWLTDIGMSALVLPLKYNKD
jgi:hypothetical protein